MKAKSLRAAGATLIAHGRSLSAADRAEVERLGLPFADHYRYWRSPRGNIMYECRPIPGSGRRADLDSRPEHIREAEREQQDAADELGRAD